MKKYPVMSTRVKCISEHPSKVLKTTPSYFSPVEVLGRLQESLKAIKPYSLTPRQLAVLSGCELVISSLVTSQVCGNGGSSLTEKTLAIPLKRIATGSINWKK